MFILQCGLYNGDRLEPRQKTSSGCCNRRRHRSRSWSGHRGHRRARDQSRSCGHRQCSGCPACRSGSGENLRVCWSWQGRYPCCHRGRRRGWNQAGGCCRCGERSRRRIRDCRKKNRTRSQCLHSYICDRFIYSHNRSAYLAGAKYVDRSWEFINRSQMYKYGNWEQSRSLIFGNTYFDSSLQCTLKEQHILKFWPLL